ncbi:hypothetical protein QYM36_000293 [Artemia franciscana]|uniref:WD repeat and FYVE domain-containing protein 3 n=1 Tax=Artemia franciscana TaxID=6661 RepID=A0AA88LJ74_ARTSF|nr:hypothetical protein QYM36_000293 [Artemia franciscana]
MRKKLIRNELFYHHYPYRPELESGDRQAKYKVAISLDSKLHHHLYETQHRSLRFAETGQPKEKLACDNESNDEINQNSCDCSWTTAAEIKPSREDSTEIFEEKNDLGLSELPSLLKNSGKRTTNDVDEDFDGPEIDIGVDASADVVSDMSSDQCSAHQTLYLICFGVLVFKVWIPLKDCYFLEKSIATSWMVIHCSDQEKSWTYRCSKLAYIDIKEVHIRKYLLQPNAIEVFSTDGRNYLLAFPRTMRNKVYQRFLATATGISDNAQQSVAGQKRSASVEQSSGILSSFMGETSVTQRWVRGEISNFQYLMYLNTLAGRSYNDLMQYPVFPWILADYDSPELDLTDPATFRELSKPMGAQTSDRLEQFKKRFREWEDPHLDTPPYHYGTHYSSAMIVCSYLIRLEPFTQHFLNLQGGHFDLADRMFHSVREAWYSAAKHNMADVKELIPEFFYLPDFLVNTNHFDLGTKQSGVQVDAVELPPWAKNDPREFIRVHREALECDYVSAHLHEWIDLIFGFKQQGQAAVDAVNVFHHLFYEGNVDIYSIEDPLKRNAIIGFINNFGQTPKPLFKKPHPAKKVGKNGFPTESSQVFSMGSAAAEKLFFHHLHTLRPSLQPIKELKRPVGQIVQQDRALLAVEENKAFIPPSNIRCVSWGYADHTIRISTYENDRSILICESQQYGDILACICPTPKLIISGGSDTVVTVWELGRKTLEVKKRLYGHTDVVTCLVAKQSYQIIVSGSRDCSAIIWDLSRLSFIRQLRAHPGPITAVSVNELTGDIATCAGTWLFLWSVNGELLASVNTLVGRADRMQQILCVAFSQALEWDPRNVVLTGSTDGVVRMWCLEYVQVPIDEPSVTTVEEKVNVEESLVKQELLKGESDQESSDDDDNQSSELHKRLQSIIAENQELLIELRGEKLGKGQLERQSSIDEPVRSSDAEVFYQSVYDHQIDGTFDQDSFEDLNSRSGSFDVKEEQGQTLPENMSDQIRQRKLSPTRRANLCKSVGNMMTLHGDFSDDSDEDLRDKPKPLKSSRSVSSLGDSFVVVGNLQAPNSENKIGQHKPDCGFKKEPRNPLREGFKWQRQLVFSSKLTMHTAFDRPDNAYPASITALQVSRDHRSVYVGDARGRIYSWSVADLPGKSMADYWLKDEVAESCRSCSTRFTLTERKHHCRNCGHVFCSRCSRFESEITRLRIRRPVRVCQTCHQLLRNSCET